MQKSARLFPLAILGLIVMAMSGCVDQYANDNATNNDTEIIDDTNENDEEENNTITEDQMVYVIKIVDEDSNEQVPEGVISTGCDDSYLVPITADVDATVDPVEGALKALLSLEDEKIGQSGLTNPLSKSNITLDSIEEENGETIINLSGTVQFGGTCEVPRVMDQVEKTIELYEEDYRIVWNGSDTGWKCLADQSGECQ